MSLFGCWHRWAKWSEPKEISGKLYQFRYCWKCNLTEARTIKHKVAWSQHETL